ncbi:MAG: YihY/virulence factor BrkB family protein [Calditerrivibrio sp.]|nr:YihY/virulence factor BrkB family protein [Calditerrivibrio sp.]
MFLFKKIKNYLLKIFVSFLYLIGNEIIILNAAVTYYALLSFLPMIIIVGLVFQNILAQNIVFLSYLEEIINSLQLDFIEYKDVLSFLKTTNTAGFGLFGVLSLFLTSTIFLRAINNVFKKIFRIKQLKESIIHNLMPFLVYMLFLISAAITVTVKFGLVLIEKILSEYLDIDLMPFLSFVDKYYIIPIVIFLFLSVVAYYLLSLKKISLFDSFKISIFFIFSVFLLNKLFKNFYNLSFYNAVYGTLSSLIITLAYTYLFFLIFLFWAQFSFVDRNYKGAIIKIFFENVFYRPKSFLIKLLRYMIKGKVVSEVECLTISDLISYDYVIVMGGELELVDSNGLSVYLGKYDFFMTNDISNDVLIKLSKDCMLLLLDEGEKRFLENDSAVAAGIFRSNEKVLIF